MPMKSKLQGRLNCRDLQLLLLKADNSLQLFYFFQFFSFGFNFTLVTIFFQLYVSNCLIFAINPDPIMILD